MAALRPRLVVTATLLLASTTAAADVDVDEAEQIGGRADEAADEPAVETADDATPTGEPDVTATGEPDATATRTVERTAAIELELARRHEHRSRSMPLPYYGNDEKERIWLPFGLLDRMRLAPFHMSATTELGTHESGSGTASLTLHAQMSTDCGCNIGIYATLPTSIALTHESRTTQALAAGGPLSPTGSDPRTQLGTLDVGLFSGTKNRRESWIYRVGTLLPTGSRDPHPWLPSARVGDRVLELPRSAGVRLSTSRIYGWKPFRPGCSFDRAFRIDAGVDVASVLALPGNPVHVIPRAGFGMMVTMRGRFIASADAAISLDPFVDDRTNLRFGAGVTGRYARADGRRSVIQPAVTLATVRTVDGWSASVLLDLTASISPKDHD